SSATSSVYGQAVTLTATIRANTPSTGTLTGSVDFFDTTTGTDLGSVAVSGGTASLVTCALGAGDHLIRATYSGDSKFTLSLDSLTPSVRRAPLTVTASSTTKTYGQAVTFAGTEFTTIGLVTANGDTVTGVTLTSAGAP